MLIGYEASALQGHKSGVGYYTENMLASVVKEAPQHRYVLFTNRDIRAGAPNGVANGSNAGHAGYASGDSNGKLNSASDLLQSPYHLSDLMSALQVYDRRFFPVRALWMQAALPIALRDVQPDLCHFTNYLAPVLKLGPIDACNCPSVVTIYDMTVFITPQFHGFKKQLLDRTLIPQVARRASAIITLSNSARNDILRYLRVPRHKVKVVPGAVSPMFHPVADPARKAAVAARYNLHHPFILYVGTIEPRKNLRRLIQAFAHLKRRSLPHKLVVVGQQGWHFQPIFAEVERLGLQNDVLFTGYVPLDDLPTLYSMCEIMAFPSLYEGFGLPVLEAMACGAPVVTSRSSSLLEVAGDAGLLVDPFSVHEIAQALYTLHKDTDLRRELAQRGIVRASRYTWDAAARATLALYEQVAGGKLADERRRT